MPVQRVAGGPGGVILKRADAREEPEVVRRRRPGAPKRERTGGRSPELGGPRSGGRKPRASMDASDEKNGRRPWMGRRPGAGGRTADTATKNCAVLRTVRAHASSGPSWMRPRKRQKARRHEGRKRGRRGRQSGSASKRRKRKPTERERRATPATLRGVVCNVHRTPPRAPCRRSRGVAARSPLAQLRERGQPASSRLAASRSSVLER